MPWSLLLLKLDEVLQLHRGPRCMQDILARQHWFFHAVRDGGHTCMSSRAALVSIDPCGSIDAEPGKANTACKLKIRYQEPGAPTVSELDVFVKEQSERMISVVLKAIGCVFSPENREVAFYRRVADPSSPFATLVPVPKPLLMRFSRAFYSVLLVLELVPAPFTTIPDWVGADPSAMEALLAGGAAIHAAFWRLPPSLADATSFLYDRKGLSFLQMVNLTLKSKTTKEVSRVVWAALQKYFDGPRMTVSHGDLRPGNMLFAPPEGRSRLPRVVFADWECLGVTPVMWDFTYGTVIGQSVQARRTLQAKQLRDYLGVLASLGVPAADLDPTVCCLETDLLVVVLLYYGSALVVLGGAGDTQGNSTNDMRAWGERIAAARDDVVDRVPVMASTIGVSTGDLRQALGLQAEPEAGLVQ